MKAEIIDVISAGQEVNLVDYLLPEHPTVFIFFQPNSTLERAFVTQLQQAITGPVGFRGVTLITGDEPVARQYDIQATPTALVYDRRGRVVGRSSNADEIKLMGQQAARVMRLDWAEAGDPRLAAAKEMFPHRPELPDILRTMTLQPDYLQGFIAMSMQAQFSDGFLDRRTKEMIATYVSALNQCKY